MVIQVILFIALSIVVAIWPNIFSFLLHGLHEFYKYLSHGLGLIFSHSAMEHLIQLTLSLLIVPLVAGIICAVVLRLMQRKKQTFVMQVVWIVWMLLVATIVLA